MPGAPRHDLQSHRVAVAQHLRHLRRIARQHHGERMLAIGGEPVALVGAQLGRRFDDAFPGHDGSQRRDELRRGEREQPRRQRASSLGDSIVELPHDGLWTVAVDLGDDDELPAATGELELRVRCARLQAQRSG